HTPLTALLVSLHDALPIYVPSCRSVPRSLRSLPLPSHFPKQIFFYRSEWESRIPKVPIKHFQQFPREVLHWRKFPDITSLPGFQDRKSTRLNSSHVKISYA